MHRSAAPAVDACVDDEPWPTTIPTNSKRAHILPTEVFETSPIGGRISDESLGSDNGEIWMERFQGSHFPAGLARGAFQHDKVGLQFGYRENALATLQYIRERGFRERD